MAIPEARRPGRYRSAALWLLLLALSLLAGCAGAPVPREHSHALPPWEVAETGLGRWAAEQAEAHPGQSGMALLANGKDAFAVRALLTTRAERRLDIQTYLMGDGLTTRALLAQVLDAAERGVEVRLLIDDIGAVGQGERLVALDSHPRVQVRAFHPLPVGRANLATRVLATIPVLPRHHRRMHNKLWVADNALAIVGGRNLGDEYYNASEPRNFADLDLLTLGEVVAPLSMSFDLYWNHGLAQPVGRYHRADAEAWRALRDRLAAWLAEENDSDYFAALRRRHEERERSRLVDALHWGRAEALWDPPGKPARRGRPALDETMGGRLWSRLAPEARLSLVSAYFVPTAEGSRALQALAEGGVEVQVVTNSLEATDVPVVHGAYMPYRRDLLKSGVALFELRAEHANGEEAAIGVPGSSASALHIKALAVDDDTVFVGSPNADPRSVWWNSEVGVLAESESLAREFRELVEVGASPALSYAVTLDEEGRLGWEMRQDDETLRLAREPGGPWRHANAWLSRLLRLERWL
ncbi:phospholipase D family protein [Halomonas sp. Y3]|uniref:phospholipase D family protein n=1 Tax=Halomonas sp. Y3 TaxID=2956797 RepID=UPI00209CA0AB|nr:phospholipase D family protein [Halomonas sp. Y3]